MWIRVTNFRIIIIVNAALLILNEVESRVLAGSSTNLTKPKLLIETNSIQRLIVDTQLNSDSNRSLKRVFISNRTIRCNDGSQAGFYLRKSSGSKKWVVFLEGGWHCYDIKSCRTRWLRLRHLMTSAQWPDSRDVGGILSPNPEDNPFWYNANHVFVPYCSSDSWSGTKMKADSRDGWRFMGSLIIRQVIADLIPLGLGQRTGSELLLAGSSAGGLGVMLNLDQIRSLLNVERKLKVNVRGVSDSGWFLDREPYTPGAIAASEAVRQGWKMWEGALPKACVKEHPIEPWRCYFGHRLYNTLRAPLFVFQWLFDEAQMRADSVGAPVTRQQWNYIHDMGGALRASLDNVTAVFAPSCIGHSVLTKRDWLNIKIDNISLSEALRCWEQSSRKKRKKARDITEIETVKKKKHKNQRRKNNNRNLRKKQREERRCRNERKRNNIKSHNTHNSQQSERILTIEEYRNYQNTQKKRRKNTTVNFKNNNKQREQTEHLRHFREHHRRNKQKNLSNFRISEPKRCSLRLLERCSWPQCNHSCPTFTNPLTGEEMRFLELLASFGLDIEAVATALGVDMQTLNNMEHTELVNLLTQQVS